MTERETRERQVAYYTQIFSAADTELRKEMASFDGIISIAEEVFDLGIENKYTPEEINDKATQINAVFEKMRKVVDSVSECIRQEADILPLLQSGSKLSPKIRVQLENIQRFFEHKIDIITTLEVFTTQPQYVPVMDSADALLTSIRSMSAVLETVLQEV